MKDLYLITEIEPCFMCAMALVHSRISRVYYVKENKFDGGFISNEMEINHIKNLNH